MIPKAAGRYASALLKTALEKDILDTVYGDMLLLQETIDNSRDLQLFLKSPLIKKAVKISAMDEIFGDKISDLTKNLLHLLSEKSREKLLHDITRAFVALHKAHHGIIDIDVESAFELNEDQVDELKSKLEKSTGKTVDLHVSVNEELMGGLKVRIDDTVIDGSVKHKLSQLKEEFKAATVE
ncbi:ATP synthase F1 subunit delta [Rhodohalobacter halophilus]|uniref:ATP synthase F1 subunit delta n=1 Tax=Rhodohalobacter halophilus TaxID=1812810 RepID=UPI00083FC812|nr:ATP synthase F1 subunit delta [Rhodohalobacter halophilus]